MDDTENDLFWHALNYRGAQSQHAELFWQELQACVARLIATEREACAKVCDEHPGNMTSNRWSSEAALSDCADRIRERSNV